MSAFKENSKAELGNAQANARGFLLSRIKAKNKNPNRSKLRGIFSLDWERLRMPLQAIGYQPS